MSSSSSSSTLSLLPALDDECWEPSNDAGSLLTLRSGCSWWTDPPVDLHRLSATGGFGPDATAGTLSGNGGLVVVVCVDATSCGASMNMSAHKETLRGPLAWTLSFSCSFSGSGPRSGLAGVGGLHSTALSKGTRGPSRMNCSMVGNAGARQRRIPTESKEPWFRSTRAPFDSIKSATARSCAMRATSKASCAALAFFIIINLLARTSRAISTGNTSAALRACILRKASGLSTCFGPLCLGGPG
jgi:hypothetical protein